MTYHNCLHDEQDLCWGEYLKRHKWRTARTTKYLLLRFLVLAVFHLCHLKYSLQDKFYLSCRQELYLTQLFLSLLFLYSFIPEFRNLFLSVLSVLFCILLCSLSCSSFYYFLLLFLFLVLFYYFKYGRRKRWWRKRLYVNTQTNSDSIRNPALCLKKWSIVKTKF